MRGWGAAVSAGLALLIATSVSATFIVFPKTWGLGEVLKSSDLNADFSAVAAQVNGNLDDGNVKANAGVQGSKLADAPNGIPATKYNDGSITGTKLADGTVAGGKLSPGAAVVGSQTQSAPTWFGPSPVVLGTTPTLTTSGGTVLITGMFLPQLIQNGAGIDVIGVSLLGGAAGNTPLRNITTNVTETAGTSVPFPLSIAFTDTPAAGPQIYRVLVSTSNANVIIGTCSSSCGFLTATELR